MDGEDRKILLVFTLMINILMASALFWCSMIKLVLG
jgi:hypothetical protein